MPQPSDHRHANVSRRHFLRTSATGVLGLSLGVALSSTAATTASAALPFTTEALTGLLAYAVPGDDRYSRQQQLTAGSPGGVGGGGTPTLARMLDEAINVPVPGPDRDLPGGVAVATLLDLTAIQFLPFGAAQPFRSAFCNLTWKRKARVLSALENQRSFAGTPLAWMASELPLLAAFVAFSEAGSRVGHTTTLTRRPAGWDITGWQGLRDGAPERRGYYRGRSAVSA